MDDLREKGTPKGLYPGFDCLWEIFSLKRGYPLFIAGSPHSGKSVFVFQLAMVMAKIYGWKVALFSGEMGEPHEIYSELCWMYMGKPYMRSYEKYNVDPMTENEKHSAESFINEYFHVIDSSDFKKGFTISSFYKKVANIEKQNDCHFDMTIIDPFNHLDKSDCDTDRDDRYLEYALPYCINDGKQNHRINVLVNHVTKVPPILDKDSGLRYIPPALPSEWANGQVWHRMAYTMLYCWRPPCFLKDDQGNALYTENQSIISNQKAKPKGSGKLGEASIFWDWKKNCYYEEIDNMGMSLQRFMRSQDEKLL